MRQTSKGQGKVSRPPWTCVSAGITSKHLSHQPSHGPALGGKSRRRPGHRILIPAVGPWQRQTSGPGPAFRSHPSCPCACSLQWMEADCWLPPLTGTDFSLPWNSLIKRAYERRNWRWGRTWTTYWIHEFRFWKHCLEWNAGLYLSIPWDRKCNQLRLHSSPWTPTAYK